MTHSLCMPDAPDIVEFFAPKTQLVNSKGVALCKWSSKTRLEAGKFNKVIAASGFCVNVVHRGNGNVVKRLVLKVVIVPVEILV
ncbi:hypothetical protein LTS18_008959, partial [Coniosporium uncinatum]